MKKSEHLIVFGGAVVEKGSNGLWVTKVTFRNYLRELTHFYDRVVFVSTVYQGPPLMSGILDIDGLSVVPVESKRNIPGLWWLLWRISKGADCIFFFPGSIVLFPIFRVLRSRVRRMAVYFAADFYHPAGLSRVARLPFGQDLFTLAHEYPARLADFIIARGRYLADKARMLNARVIETVPLGHMDIGNRQHEAKRAQHNSTKCALFVGKLEESKGVDFLLRGFLKFCRQYPEVRCRLDILGAGPYSKECRKMIGLLGLEECVRAHGYIESEKEMARFWANADVLIMPSTHPEGVPRVIDEAMLREIPVIATRVGGVPHEFGPQEVVLIEPRDSTQIADAMKSVFFNDELRKDLVARGKERASRWLAEGSAARQHAKLMRMAT